MESKKTTAKNAWTSSIVFLLRLSLVPPKDLCSVPVDRGRSWLDEQSGRSKCSCCGAGGRSRRCGRRGRRTGRRSQQPGFDSSPAARREPPVQPKPSFKGVVKRFSTLGLFMYGSQLPISSFVNLNKLKKRKTRSKTPGLPETKPLSTRLESQCIAWQKVPYLIEPVFVNV